MAETDFYYYLLLMLMLETIKFCWLNLGIVYLRVTVYLNKMSDFIQHYDATPLDVFSQFNTNNNLIQTNYSYSNEK